jgi:hypothetical protein
MTKPQRFERFYFLMAVFLLVYIGGMYLLNFALGIILAIVEAGT